MTDTPNHVWIGLRGVNSHKADIGDVQYTRTDLIQPRIDAAVREALERAAKDCDDEADKCDDAVKWGGAKKYIEKCKAASYAIRNRAAAIRVLAASLPAPTPVDKNGVQHDPS